MTDIWLIAALVLLAIAVAALPLLWRKTAKADSAALGARLDAFEKAQERTERVIREEMVRSREELGRAAREQRQELVAALKDFGDAVVQRMTGAAATQKAQLENFSAQLASFTKASTEQLDGIREESAVAARDLRSEVLATLKALTEANVRTMGELAGLQKDQLEAMSCAIAKLTDSNEKKLEAVRTTVEGKLQSIQHDNARQLEQMRQTVEEKLQGALEKRLGESFKQVSERLEMVHKGLGEMQLLAAGVGDLKRVLTNVKTRGTWGEVQLGTLLEQVLSPDQYAVNVATRGNGERVEFAIKLPGLGADENEPVWLPIDAKFPIEDYQRLLDAQESANSEGAEAAGRQLEGRVKACAADICRKYLNPPKTTDFGILFLPIEGLFAEVIRRAGLTEYIQREHRVVIAGPTTLWSLLSSLQMGFRTLAIQKRSSEVWNLLAAVKTEWSKYGDLLESVQKKLQQASDTIEKAKVRSRAVGRKLKDVEELPLADAADLLPDLARVDGGIIVEEDEGAYQA